LGQCTHRALVFEDVGGGAEEEEDEDEVSDV